MLVSRVVENAKAHFPGLEVREWDLLEHPELAPRYGVMAAPAIVINGRLAFTGVPRETDLRRALLGRYPQATTGPIQDPLTIQDSSVSDERLMAQVRKGSVRAFEVLYERHHRSVFTLLLRFLSDRPTAEDLLQETFLRVYLHRETYQPTATFRTWLFTIARNMALDQLRRRGVACESPSGEDWLAVVPDASPGPLRRVEALERLDELEHALRQLPPSQREVLLLSRFAGLSHAEIAQVTGTSLVAIRVTLHRALRALRKLLGSGE